MMYNVTYDSIPDIKFEGRYIKQYIANDSVCVNNDKKYYYMLEMDDNNKFYIESCKHNLSLEDAYKVYEKDEATFKGFETIDELEIETIQCGTYIDDSLRAAWVYFHQ